MTNDEWYSPAVPSFNLEPPSFVIPPKASPFPNAMRILLLSRRFFPAISGMSVYALNLVRELVSRRARRDAGQPIPRDPAGAGVYGGGPPPDVPGAHVIGLESRGEQAAADGRPADWEADIETMVAAIEWAHEEQPLDVIHAQYAYPTGLAALEAARRLRVPCVVSVQGGDGHWIGPCCETHRTAMRRRASTTPAPC